MDYIVVGLGLSGLAVTAELDKRKREFIVFENNSQKSSYVAGGIYNPVILKRFTPAWKACEQIDIAIPFYKQLEEKFGIRIVNPWSIYRRFHSVEEQNDWFVAADKPRLSRFLDPVLKKNDNPNLIASYSLGKVCETGNIDTECLLDTYRAYLDETYKLRHESFDYDNLKYNNGYWEYNGLQSRNVIFCEGFGLKKNPYFNYLPLTGNKGEYITIYSEELQLDFAVKSSVFLMPLGNNLYKVGATYDNHDKSPEPTPAAREKLISQLKQLIRCDFEVVDQLAGIRPSVSDRRPVVGKHPEHEHMYCCNGYGSRGVLIAPNMAAELLDHIENDKKLDPETDLDRFTSKYYNS